MRKIILPFIFLFFLSCNKKITSALSQKMIELEAKNGLPNDFKKLDKFIQNKEIILLGEAAHGEGKTFEVKTQIVKYLVEEKGFNTIALEGMDFLEMEYINGRHILKDNLVDDFESEWYKYWNPWHPAKQLIPFENFIKKEKLSSQLSHKLLHQFHILYTGHCFKLAVHVQCKQILRYFFLCKLFDRCCIGWFNTSA